MTQAYTFLLVFEFPHTSGRHIHDVMPQSNKWTNTRDASIPVDLWFKDVFLCLLIATLALCVFIWLVFYAPFRKISLTRRRPALWWEGHLFEIRYRYSHAQLVRGSIPYITKDPMPDTPPDLAQRQIKQELDSSLWSVRWVDWTRESFDPVVSYKSIPHATELSMVNNILMNARISFKANSWYICFVLWSVSLQETEMIQ